MRRTYASIGSAGSGISTWPTAKRVSAMGVSMWFSSCLPGACRRIARRSERSMVKVRVSEVIPSERHRVWAELARIEDHVAWMMDATAIRFLTTSRSGVGTRFECDTRVGPLRLTDVMEITEWVNAGAMGVRHIGAVRGSGRFTLTDAPGRATHIEWEEQLTLPWWLGTTMGAWLAKPVCAALWRGNLRRLGHRITAGASSPEQGSARP